MPRCLDGRRQLGVSLSSSFPLLLIESMPFAAWTSGRTYGQERGRGGSSSPPVPTAPAEVVWPSFLRNSGGKWRTRTPTTTGEEMTAFLIAEEAGLASGGGHQHCQERRASQGQATDPWDGVPFLRFCTPAFSCITNNMASFPSCNFRFDPAMTEIGHAAHTPHIIGKLNR